MNLDIPNVSAKAQDQTVRNDLLEIQRWAGRLSAFLKNLSDTVDAGGGGPGGGPQGPSTIISTTIADFTTEIHEESFIGVPGPQGAAGASGSAGSAGQDGLRGIQGEDGEQGERGLPGAGIDLQLAAGQLAGRASASGKGPLQAITPASPLGISGDQFQSAVFAGTDDVVTDGTQGDVPGPVVGQGQYPLRGDGTWGPLSEAGLQTNSVTGIQLLDGSVTLAKQNNLYAPSASFTLANGAFYVFAAHMRLSTTIRATLAGDARVAIV